MNSLSFKLPVLPTGHGPSGSRPKAKPQVPQCPGGLTTAGHRISDPGSLCNVLTTYRAFHDHCLLICGTGVILVVQVMRNQGSGRASGFPKGTQLPSDGAAI